MTPGRKSPNMKTPPKKSGKPRAKLGRAAGGPRSAGSSSLGARTAGRGAKGEGAALVDFETQGRADISLPADAHVIGEPVTVTSLRNPGLPRVGLLATCQRGERRYEIGLADVSFAAESPAAKLVARYRAWLGLPAASEPTATALPPHKVTHEDLTVGKPVELIVLACKSNAIRCRLLGTSREVTLRTAVRNEVPG